MSIRSIVPTARSGSTGKVVSAREAVRLIRVGNTVAIGGFFEIGLAVEVVHELGALFGATDEESAAYGRPRDLTLVFCVSPGDWASGGANRLAEPGLVKRIIGGHWSGVCSTIPIFYPDDGCTLNIRHRNRSQKLENTSPKRPARESNDGLPHRTRAGVCRSERMEDSFQRPLTGWIASR